MNIIKFEELNSTNTYAKENIETFADKTIICAKRQTEGRGRFKRKWVDIGCENIYMSFILKPSDKFSFIYANLTQYLSVIISETLENIGLKPQIRWPNDVLINNKKLVGILCETVMRGDNFKGLVLGIGINVNADKTKMSEIDKPATSINLELGKNINKDDFMNTVINNFFEKYDEFLSIGFPLIKNDYLKRINCLGKNIKVAILDKTFVGTVEEIDVSGNLILRLDNGERKVINMGEIV